VKAPVDLAVKLADRAEKSRAEIGRRLADGKFGVSEFLQPSTASERIGEFLIHARRQVDLIVRRIPKARRFPMARRCTPSSGPHPMERGVPVCVLEDRYRFILHHEVIWAEHDTDMAVPMVESAQSDRVG